MEEPQMNNTKISSQIMQKIDRLNVSDEAKEVLRRIEKVASSENRIIKASVKDIFVTCPADAGLKEFAHTYESIIMKNRVYQVKGTRTYLELAFPKYGSEQDYHRFFQSPKIVASILNKFVGVFMISFEQWSSSHELIKDGRFKQLLKFIEDNKNNISFIFHTLPDFENSMQLMRELEKHINLLEVQLTYPDLREATEYIASKLKESGMNLDSNANEKFTEFIKEKLNVESKAYKGFLTLDKLFRGIQFELCSKIELQGEKTYAITAADIKDLHSQIEGTSDEHSYQGKLGFS